MKFLLMLQIEDFFLYVTNSTRGERIKHNKQRKYKSNMILFAPSFQLRQIENKYYVSKLIKIYEFSFLNFYPMTSGLITGRQILLSSKLRRKQLFSLVLSSQCKFLKDIILGKMWNVSYETLLFLIWKSIEIVFAKNNWRFTFFVNSFICFVKNHLFTIKTVTI